MLSIYDAQGLGLVRRDGPLSIDGAVWIDLLNPTKEEEREIEAKLGLLIPTREEMSEIETSSRLYQESGAYFMTATVIYQVEMPNPQSTPITFILTDSRLITVRYAEPKAFQLFMGRAAKGDTGCDTPVLIMLGILEAIIDRASDLIERLQAETDRVAQTIFDMKGGSGMRTKRFDVILKKIGREGEVASKSRESLLSLWRLLTYLGQVAHDRKDAKGVRERIKTETRDVQSLADHLNYLNARVTFLLDASLGLVSIEQNQIIKLFSVAAVALLPPTLIASVYGMNFHHMPELDWPWGYPFALVVMLLSAVLPFLYFRRKGWL
jgi:magnesium transporter